MARIHHRPWVRASAAAALAAYIRLVERSGRFELRADPATIDLVRQRRPFIGAFWHGRMMLMEPAWRRLVAEAGVSDPLRPCVISSDHADSILVAQVIRRLGLDVVHGSNKRRGLAIYRNALRILGAGRIAVMTPDGPRGPAEEAKPGIVRLARQAAVPIVPVSFAAHPVRRLRSWDSFLVPLPFARGIMAIGAPLWIAPSDDLERARLEVGRSISGLSQGVQRDLSGPVAASPT